MKLPKLAASVLLMLAPISEGLADERARFLPFVGPQFEAARYGPATEEFAWVGWVGATVDLVEKGKWSAYFNPNVETVLGHRVRSFEAVQANYSLEVGGRKDVGAGRISGFFHHVSRHVQDRDKPQAVDWNFLGVKYDAPWPLKWDRRGGFSGSLGVATLSSGVDYSWEMRAAGDIDLFRQGKRAVYALATVRHVGASPTPDFPRDSVTDARLEFGVRRFQEKAQCALFIGFERRSDALVSAALVANRALLGFRFRGQRRSAPAFPPLP